MKTQEPVVIDTDERQKLYQAARCLMRQMVRLRNEYRYKLRHYATYSDDRTHIEMEVQHMLYKRLLYLCISDLLESGQFIFEGTARELNVPNDALVEIYLLRDGRTSFQLGIDILKLHKQFFPDIYRCIQDKSKKNQEEAA